MKERNPHARWLRPLIIFGTIVLAWSASLIGQQFQTVQVEVGQPAPQDFVTEAPFQIQDVEATNAAIEEAVAGVETLFERDTEADIVVLEDIQALYEAIAAGTVVTDADPLVQATTTTTLPPTTTTTVAESTTTTEPADGEGGETTTTAAFSRFSAR